MAKARKPLLWGLAASLIVAAGWLGVMGLAAFFEQDRILPPTDPLPAPLEEAIDSELSVAPEQEEPEPPDYALVGTVLASDPRWSRASIMDPLAKTQLYRRGDRLADGSMVVAIAKTEVLLVKAGERRVLVLDPKARLAPVRPAPELDVEASSQAKEPQNPIAGLEKVRDGIYRLRRDAVRARLDRPDDLFSDTTASLVFGQQGEVLGLRLRLEDPASLFARLGFLDGDVLVRVGSLAIDSPDRLDGLVALIESAREIEVQLIRAGRTQRIRFWLDDR